MNWGATQWYDLAYDPQARNNLTRSIVWPAPEFAEGGIFNQVMSGTEPDDVRLFSRPAERFFPQSPRRFEIVWATPARVVVEGTCHPIGNAVGVLDNVTVMIRYDIRPDGMMLIRSRLSVERAQSMRHWLCGIFGVCDFTSSEAIIPPDSAGWIRSSATQRPYRWREPPDPFVYAYWGQQTGEHRDWARASIMLAWLGGDLPPTRHYPHNWPGYKRFGYVRDQISLPAGASVTQNWAIQLGTRAGPGLPDLSSAEACRVALAKLGR